MPQNYEVQVHAFGQYPRGAVVPEWVVRGAGSVREQVARGIVRPTDAAVNVDLHKLGTPAVGSDFGATVDEVHRLRLQVGELKETLAQQTARAEAAEAAHAALRDATIQLTDENAHLGQACDDHQARAEQLERQVAELTAQLDAATAPAD